MAQNGNSYDGSFISTGANVFIPLRGGVTEFEVWNYTAQAAGTASTNFHWYWQAGMPAGFTLYDGFTAAGGGAVTAGQLAGSLFYTDTSVVNYTFSGQQNITITAGATPTVTYNAHGLNTGDIIRFLNLPAAVQPLGAIDWIVTRTGANTFTIPAAASNVGVGATAGTQIVKLSREGLYVPEDRVIVSIGVSGNNANNATITFAAPHEFQVGNDVRINVNSITNAAVATYLKTTYGASPSLNPQLTVARINSNISIDVVMNVNAMPAFVFPLAASVPFTPSQVTPIGQDTAYSLTVVPPVDILGDQPNGNGKGPNIAQIGITLIGSGAGASVLPAGSSATPDVIYWRASIPFNQF